MNIIHGTITLRAIEERDLQFCFDMINDPQIEISTIGKNYPISSQQQRNWFLNGNDTNTVRLLIEVKNTGPVGMVMISDINWINRTAELGIKFCSGVARERKDTENTTYAIFWYVFNEMNLHCVYANVLKDNLFSRKLLLLNGFTEEGTLRARVYKRGTYHDIVVYSLLQDDFFKKNTKTVLEKKE